MKKVILTLSVVMLLAACNKSDDAPTPIATTPTTPTTSSCSSTNTLLTGKDWVPVGAPSYITTNRYETDGKYYENGTYEGTWSLTQNCDSIASLSINNWAFTDYIISISADTLVVNNSIHGQLTYASNVGGGTGNPNFYFNVDIDNSNTLADKYDLLDSIIYSNRRTGELHALNVQDYRQTYFPNNVVVPQIDSLVFQGGGSQITTKVWMPITFMVGDTVDTRVVFGASTSGRFCFVHMHKVIHGTFTFPIDPNLYKEQSFVIDHN